MPTSSFLVWRGIAFLLGFSPCLLLPVPGGIVADLGRLATRLSRLEESARKFRGADAAPRMVTVLSWEGESEAAGQYCEELRALWSAAPELPYIEHLRLAGPRPAGLKAAWSAPRQFIDYTPGPAELTDLRPDLRPPTAGHTRKDWNP